MNKQEWRRRSEESISEAIRRAKEYAQSQDVPLTVERLAAELDMDLDSVRAIADGRFPVSGKGSAAKAALIRRAAGEATASVVEHAMRRGTGTNMHLLYLKNNAGYDQPKGGKTGRDDRDGGSAPVVFTGEEDILE